MSMQRLLSGLLYLAYAANYFKASKIESTFWIMTGLLLPLMCIWFSVQLGDYMGGGEIPFTKKSPGAIVKGVGWIILLIPAIQILSSY